MLENINDKLDRIKQEKRERAEPPSGRTSEDGKDEGSEEGDAGEEGSASYDRDIVSGRSVLILLVLRLAVYSYDCICIGTLRYI